MKNLYFFIAASLLVPASVMSQCAWAPVGPSDSSTVLVNYASYNEQPSLVVRRNHYLYAGFDNYGNTNKAAVLQYDGANWSFLGGPGFSAGSVDYSSLVFTPSDSLYMAYRDNVNGYKATVMKYNGSAWVKVGGGAISPGGVAYTSLTTDSKGNLYVAYLDSTNASKATVMKYNGTTWAPLGTAGFTSGGVNMLQSAMSKADTIFIAYTDINDSNKVIVMKFNGTNWVNVGSPDFSFKGINYTLAFALNSTGTPYVAFDDAGRKEQMTVMKYNGTKWDTLGIRGFSPDHFNVGYTASMVINKTGQPVVSYAEYSSAGRGGYPVVNTFNGTAWVQITSSEISNGSWGVMYQGFPTSLAIDDSSGALYLSLGVFRYANTMLENNGSGWVNIGTPGASPGYALGNSLAVNSKGVPYIAYEDGADSNRMTVRAFNGTNWVNMGIQGFSPGMVSTNCIAFGPNDTVYAAFVDAKQANKITAMKYNGTNWVGVGSAGFSTGHFNAYSFEQGLTMVFDNTGAPCVCYADSATGYATVMRFNGSTWVSTGTLIKSRFALIAKDGSDNMYVAALETATSNKVSVVKYSGSSWSYLGTSSFSWANIDYIAFAISKAGTPYVGFGQYAGFDRFAVESYNGSNWAFVGDTVNILPGSGGVNLPTMATDNSGTPYLAYQEYGGGGPVLKYVGTDKWESVGVPQYQFQEGICQIAFTPQDTMYFAYSSFCNYVRRSGCAVLTSADAINANNDEQIRVFPNPSNGVFTIQITGNDQSMTNSHLDVYNVLGEKLPIILNLSHNGAMKNSTIDMVNYPAGIYFYRIISEKGGLIGSGKLIKE